MNRSYLANSKIWHITYTRDPLYSYGMNSVPALISNHTHYEVWDEIAYPFPNFKEWISNLNPYFIADVLT